MPGPVPKRTDQRRRRNKPEGLQVVQAAGAQKVKVPPANSKWCTPAKRWYISLKTSGQAVFFQPSDWEAARIVCDLLTQEYDRPGGIRPTMIESVFGMMSNLLTTEGDRRRLRIELTRGEQDHGDPVTLSIIEGYREQLGS